MQTQILLAQPQATLAVGSGDLLGHWSGLQIAMLLFCSASMWILSRDINFNNWVGRQSIWQLNRLGNWEKLGWWFRGLGWWANFVCHRIESGSLLSQFFCKVYISSGIHNLFSVYVDRIISERAKWPNR
jgi:hypothetical protein